MTHATGSILRQDVPLAEYLTWPILSQTVLKEGLASMAHLRAALDEERVKVPTDEMLLGSALHVCFLEPEAMPQRVVLWEGPRRAGKEWEAFREQHDGKVILTAGMYANLSGMVKNLRRHPFVRQWVGRIEGTEVCAVGKVAGVEMKGRVDAQTLEPLVDLKKVRSADPRIFTRQVLTFGYHIQAWVYCQLFNRQQFVLIAVEDQPPYDAVAYELSPAFLRQGERTTRALLEKYQQSVRFGVWPGRSDQVMTLEPPEWAVDHASIEFDELPADDTAVVMLGGLDKKGA